MRCSSRQKRRTRTTNNGCETTRTYVLPSPPGDHEPRSWAAALAGALLALQDLLQVEVAIEPDWTTLECARANRWSKDIRMARAPLASSESARALAAARPAVLVGNASRGYDPHHSGETSARQASDIVDAFTASRAETLLVESPVGFARTAAWQDSLGPRLVQARCSVEDATVAAVNVGVPIGKQRVLVVAVKHRLSTKPEELSEKLTKWKLRLQDPSAVGGLIPGAQRPLLPEAAAWGEGRLQLLRAGDHPHARSPPVDANPP